MSREMINIWENEIVILYYKKKLVECLINVSYIEHYAEGFVIVGIYGTGRAFEWTEYDYEVKYLYRF